MRSVIIFKCDCLLIEEQVVIVKWHTLHKRIIVIYYIYITFLLSHLHRNIDALEPSEGMIKRLKDTSAYDLKYQEFIGHGGCTVPAGEKNFPFPNV